MNKNKVGVHNPGVGTPAVWSLSTGNIHAWYWPSAGVYIESIIAPLRVGCGLSFFVPLKSHLSRQNLMQNHIEIYLRKVSRNVLLIALKNNGFTGFAGPVAQVAQVCANENRVFAQFESLGPQWIAPFCLEDS